MYDFILCIYAFAFVICNKWFTYLLTYLVEIIGLGAEILEGRVREGGYEYTYILS